MIELGEVLMIGEGAEVETGTPLLARASVAATVVAQTRAPKIIVFKKQRRKNYRRKKGHRQHQTVLRIAEIRGAGGAGPRAFAAKSSSSSAAPTAATAAKAVTSSSRKSGGTITGARRGIDSSRPCYGSPRSEVPAAGVMRKE